MSDYRQLLILASDLTASDSPTEVELRRSVSTLYYAVFHRLMKLTADALVPDDIGSTQWVRVYRVLDHRKSKNQLKVLAERISGLEKINSHFEKLQSDREKADYDPEPYYLTKSDVRLLIKEVVVALEQLDTLSKSECLEVAIEFAIPKRSDENLRTRQ